MKVFKRRPIKWGKIGPQAYTAYLGDFQFSLLGGAVWRLNVRNNFAVQESKEFKLCREAKFYAENTIDKHIAPYIK